MENELRQMVLTNTNDKQAILYWSVDANVKRQNSIINLTNANVRALFNSGIIELRDMAEYARAKQIMREKNKTVNLSLFAMQN